MPNHVTLLAFATRPSTAERSEAALGFGIWSWDLGLSFRFQARTAHLIRADQHRGFSFSSASLGRTASSEIFEYRPRSNPSRKLVFTSLSSPLWKATIATRAPGLRQEGGKRGEPGGFPSRGSRACGSPGRSARRGAGGPSRASAPGCLSPGRRARRGVPSYRRGGGRAPWRWPGRWRRRPAHRRGRGSPRPASPPG